MEASALKYQAGLSLQTRPPLLRLQSDDRLVALSRRGVPAAFEILVKRYETRLLGFCRHLLGSREDAEDVLQEVFAAAYNAMLGDDRPINVRPWLYRIARNRSLNHLRRAQAIGVDSMDVHLAEHGTTTADKVHSREEFRLLVGDIQSLPETQRTALVLREMDALSYEQIAEAMETTVPSVKSLLVRARVSLAEAAEARALPCENVRTELGEVAEGLTRRPSTLVRRHMRGCVRCEAFGLQLKETNKALGVVMPVGPLAALKKLLVAHLGHGAGSAGSAGSGMGVAGSTSAAAGTAAAGTAAAGSMIAAGGSGGFAGAGFGALASKAAAGLAAAALVTAGAVAVDPTAGHRAASPAGALLHADVTPQVLPDPANAEQQQVFPAAARHGAARHPAPVASKPAVDTAATVPGPAKPAAPPDPVKPAASTKPPAKPTSSTSSGTTQEQTVTTILAPSPGSTAPTGTASPGSAPSSDAGSPAGSGSGSGSSGTTDPSGSSASGSSSGSGSGAAGSGSSGSGSSGSSDPSGPGTTSPASGGSGLPTIIGGTIPAPVPAPSTSPSQPSSSTSASPSTTVDPTVTTGAPPPASTTAASPSAAVVPAGSPEPAQAG